ncbi:MAG: GAF domain-containing protein [Chloroflexi bacterium]|nr:GAF domain-containing protein [Chloroflexota bacterium]
MKGNSIRKLSWGRSSSLTLSASELATLFPLTTVLARAPLQSGLDQALDILRATTGAEAAELFLAESEERGMAMTSFRGPFKNAFFGITRFKPGEGFPGMVLAGSAPIISTSLPEDPRYLREQVKERGFHSYLCVPLLGPEGVMGCINTAFRRPDADMERAMAILSWASAPLSMRLQVDLLRLGEMLDTSGLGVGEELEANLDTVLGEILRRMIAQSGAQGGLVSLLRRGEKGLAWHLSEGPIPTVTCPALQSEADRNCRAIAEGRSVVLFGTRESWPVQCQRFPRLGSVIYCMPLAMEVGILGLVQLVYQGPSPEPPTRDLVLMETAAERASRTISEAWNRLETRQRIQAAYRQWLHTENELSLQKGISSQSASAPAQAGAEQMPMTHLDLQCLGPFAVYRKGTLVTSEMVQRRKALTLLKILLTYDGRPVSKETLIELLWPEVEPSAGAGRLYTVVHALRRLVEPPGHEGKWLFVQNEGDQYWFNTKGPCRIDVREFKMLVEAGKRAEARGNAQAAIAAFEEAVRLYRGDFLEDERFSEWCWMEREELRETCLDTLKRLAALHAEEGSWEKAAKHLRGALRVDSLREELHRELIRSLWALGRRDEAIRQYEACRDLLQRELGIGPLPETDHLLQLIRRSAHSTHGTARS